MRFQHKHSRIVVYCATEAGKRHCLGSPHWEPYVPEEGER
jgi:hypothetical protein